MQLQNVVGETTLVIIADHRATARVARPQLLAMSPRVLDRAEARREVRPVRRYIVRTEP
jgi:hypothetical protein